MNVESMSGPELVTAYNQIATKIGEPTVKRFSSRAAGIDRVKQIQQIQRSVTRAATRKQSESKLHPKGFNLPRLAGAKVPREGTLRKRVFDLVERGTTMDEVQELMIQFDGERGVATKNPKGRAYKNIRMLHFYAGFGLETRDDGKIYLIR